MLTLQQVVDGIKRDAQQGEVGNNADTVASDILRQYNLSAIAFWEKNNWDWGKVAKTLTVTASQSTETTLDATIGEIISVGIQGQSGELEEFTEREWRRWRKLQDTTSPSGSPITTTASVIGFVRRGRDSSGNIKVLFVNPPASDTVIEVEGKTRLVGSSGTSYVVADIATVTTPNYTYFPDEAMGVLYDWTLGRLLRALKDERAEGLLGAVDGRITMLKGTQRSMPAERATTHPPDYIRFVNRKRGGRSVV